MKYNEYSITWRCGDTGEIKHSKSYGRSQYDALKLFYFEQIEILAIEEEDFNLEEDLEKILGRLDSNEDKS